MTYFLSVLSTGCRDAVTAYWQQICNNIMCDCVYHLSVRSEQSSYTLDSLVPKALPHTNQIKFELQVMKQGYDLDITSILKPRDSTKT